MSKRTISRWPPNHGVARGRCPIGYTVIGLICGALYTCITLLRGIVAPANGDARAFGAAIGILAIVFFPLVYGVLGLVSGALTAWLYNVFAGIVGGIELQLEPSHGPAAL